MLFQKKLIKQSAHNSRIIELWRHNVTNGKKWMIICIEEMFQDEKVLIFLLPYFVFQMQKLQFTDSQGSLKMASYNSPVTEVAEAISSPFGWTIAYFWRTIWSTRH